MEEIAHNPPQTASLAWFEEQVALLGRYGGFYRSYAEVIEKLCYELYIRAKFLPDQKVYFLGEEAKPADIVHAVFDSSGKLDKQKTILTNLPKWLDEYGEYLDSWRIKSIKPSREFYPPYCYEETEYREIRKAKEKSTDESQRTMDKPHQNLQKLSTIQELIERKTSDTTPADKAVCKRLLDWDRYQIGFLNKNIYNNPTPLDGTDCLIFAPHKLFIRDISIKSTHSFDAEFAKHCLIGKATFPDPSKPTMHIEATPAPLITRIINNMLHAPHEVIFRTAEQVQIDANRRDEQESGFHFRTYAEPKAQETTEDHPKRSTRKYLKSFWNHPNDPGKWRT